MEGKSLLSQFSAEEVEQIKAELKIMASSQKTRALAEISKNFKNDMNKTVTPLNLQYNTELDDAWNACIRITDYIFQNYTKRKVKHGIKYSRHNCIPKEMETSYKQVIAALCEFIIEISRGKRL